MVLYELTIRYVKCNLLIIKPVFFVLLLSVLRIELWSKIFNAFLTKLLVFKATLTYDKVTIVIHGLAHIPFAILDPSTNVLRALALHYSDIIEYLKQSGIEYSDHVFTEEMMMSSSSL